MYPCIFSGRKIACWILCVNTRLRSSTNMVKLSKRQKTQNHWALNLTSTGRYTLSPSFCLSFLQWRSLCLYATNQKSPNVDCHNSNNFNRLRKWQLKAIVILEQLPTSNSKYCTALSLSRTLFFLSKWITLSYNIA